MKYKGWLIEPQYHTGSDFSIDKNNCVRNRNQTKADIAYYIILDPMNDNKRWVAEHTVAECKATIDAFQIKCGMPNNLPATWGKLK